MTGWSRDNARRRLAQAVQPRPVRSRPGRPRKFSADAVAVLERVWGISGGSCGKYLAPAMVPLLDALETHGELVDGERNYSAEVRAQLVAMSAATIDRYLAAPKARAASSGTAATRPGTLLRNSISVRRAGDEVEADPGFFEADTVAHGGPCLEGEFARTVNLTDTLTGWVFTTSIRSNARVQLIAALDRAVTAIPFEVVGLGCEAASEFVDQDVIAWAAGRDVHFTGSRPDRMNDPAAVGSRNNHLVRRYAFDFRYEGPEAMAMLNRLWPLVNDRLNYFTPTKKPTGWVTTGTGRRRRNYDSPRTPLERLLEAGTISPAQAAELRARRAAINPAELARDIRRIQDRLAAIARRPTQDLADSLVEPIPDTVRGVRTRRTA
ncbi:integrase [Occultella aeris]|uniref:integrase n=1 Tax=Occultella aeris TaxID=2761496 RepID=UPI003B43111C